MKKLLHRFYDPSLASVELSGAKMSLFAIFVPILIEQILLNMMSTVNTVMLSHYSDDAVAAVAAAGQWIGMITTLFLVISYGSAVVIGQKLGAQKEKSAFESAVCSLFFTIIATVGISTFFSLNAGSLMSFMNLTGEIYDQAVSYFRITAQFCCMAGISTCMYAIFRCYGQPRISLGINLFMNVLNAFFNYLVIFKRVSYLPEGVEGVAVSYAIAQITGTAVAGIIFVRYFRHQKFSLRKAVSLENLFQVLRFGVPSGVTNLSYSVSQLVTTSIVASLGVAMITTKTYVSTVVYYVYVVGAALGIATSLMVSWLVGAKDYEHAYRLNLQNLRLTVFINTTFSIMVYVFRKQIFGIFTSDPLILKTIPTLLLLDVIVQIFRSFNLIEENSLRGAGDVIITMITATCSCWILSVFVGYILSIKCGLGLAGCWMAFALDEMCRGFIYLHRWRTRKWQRQRI